MMYQNLLDRLVEESRRIFGAALTGVYLHGSMAMGCFQPDQSDIDFIVVVNRDITEEQKLDFMNMVVTLDRQAPEKGLECSIVHKACCKEFVYPTPFMLHFSKAHLQWFTDNPMDYIRKMNGTDKDLAAHFQIIKKYGIALCGAEIEEVFADVPRTAYIDSICSDIADAKEEILENPVYIILNLCRVTAFLENDKITSKKQGGEWALENLSKEYRPLISSALQSYASGEKMRMDEAEGQKFAEEMLQKINNKLSAVNG